MSNELDKALGQADKNREQIHAAWLKSVQAIADKYQVEIATGHLSDVWQVSEPGKDEWAAEYDKPENETLRDALNALMELDDKTSPHGVGPSNMEWFKPNPPENQYEKQARDFLTKHGIKFRATLSDSKIAPWGGDNPLKGKAEPHHYRVTLSRSDAAVIRASWKPLKRIVFDFWGSIADAEKGETTVSAYDVLACISGDVHCAETFKDFCADFGESEDSIKALQTFRRCSAFAKRLRAFFTDKEIEELSEIN